MYYLPPPGQNNGRPLEAEYNQESEQYIGPSGKQKFKKKQTKKYNFAKIRKFRIAVIAVYFYLLFPKYVNRFTRKRFSMHR
jgi:hypothetical protein